MCTFWIENPILHIIPLIRLEQKYFSNCLRCHSLLYAKHQLDPQAVGNVQMGWSSNMVASGHCWWSTFSKNRLFLAAEDPEIRKIALLTQNGVALARRKWLVQTACLLESNILCASGHAEWQLRCKLCTFWSDRSELDEWIAFVKFQNGQYTAIMIHHRAWFMLASQWTKAILTISFARILWCLTFLFHAFVWCLFHLLILRKPLLHWRYAWEMNTVAKKYTHMQLGYLSHFMGGYNSCVFYVFASSVKLLVPPFFQTYFGTHPFVLFIHIEFSFLLGAHVALVYGSLLESLNGCSLLSMVYESWCFLDWSAIGLFVRWMSDALVLGLCGLFHSWCYDRGFGWVFFEFTYDVIAMDENVWCCSTCQNSVLLQLFWTLGWFLRADWVWYTFLCDDLLLFCCSFVCSGNSGEEMRI